MKNFRQIMLALLATLGFSLCANQVFACGDSNNQQWVIIDMIGGEGLTAVDVNLDLFGCGKSDTGASSEGYGTNAINIADWHVMSRSGSGADTLQMTVGHTDVTVTQQNLNTVNQNRHFFEGYHLFDLERFRAVADWLSTPGNITPDAGVQDGCYGTIYLYDFFDCLHNHETMYGLVRVKVPVEQINIADLPEDADTNPCDPLNDECRKNALGEWKYAAEIYDICKAKTGLCTCKSQSIQVGKAINCVGSVVNDINLVFDAQIKVKGAIMYDFVDYLTEEPVPLEFIPFSSQDLYFKVDVPIKVNWANDKDDDGVMDTMELIASINAASVDLLSPVVGDSLNIPLDFDTDGDGLNDYTWEDVPQESKEAWLYKNGSALTEAIWTGLDNASKYHLLMPSGYAQGWADAFDKLNITAETWTSIPVVPAIGLPVGATGVITPENVRDAAYEDWPVYVYSGGMTDMHAHANISGVLYGAQAMELEAKAGGFPGDRCWTVACRQYYNGAIIVRDTFYIESNSNSITVLSSNPDNFSNATLTAQAAANLGGGSGSGTFATNSSISDATGLGVDGQVDEDGNPIPPPPGYTGQPNAGANRWIEVRPDNGSN